MFKRLGGRAIDHPLRVDLALLALVVLHAAVTYVDRIPRLDLPALPNLWSRLATGESSPSAITIYLGLVGPAALLASFAGVVVIFGLSMNSERFRKFRTKAGRSLRRTWIAASASGFAACGLFIAAVLLAALGAESVAPWVFEFGLLVVIHGSVRLIWITVSLIGITAADDATSTDDANKRPLSALPFVRNGNS